MVDFSQQALIATIVILFANSTLYFTQEAMENSHGVQTISGERKITFGINNPSTDVISRSDIEGFRTFSSDANSDTNAVVTSSGAGASIPLVGFLFTQAIKIANIFVSVFTMHHNILDSIAALVASQATTYGLMIRGLFGGMAIIIDIILFFGLLTLAKELASIASLAFSFLSSLLGGLGSLGR